MAPNTTTTLDLGTDQAGEGEDDRRMVKWRGAEYALGDPTELSAGGVVRMERAIERVGGLADDDARRQLTDEQIEQVDADMRWLVGLALPDAPPDALDALAGNVGKAMALIEAFAGDSATTEQTTPTPLSASSLESNDSTGVALSGGQD